jgi:hypothetical protein
MFHVNRAVLCVLAAVSLAACASTTKPPARSLTASGHLVARGKVDDPRYKHFHCLQQHHIQATEEGYYTIQVGRKGVGPLIHFLASPGAAQYKQISGQVESAEVIGGALLYPNQASDGELQTVEACTALGVNG